MINMCIVFLFYHQLLECWHTWIYLDHRCPDHYVSIGM